MIEKGQQAVPFPIHQHSRRTLIIVDDFNDISCDREKVKAWFKKIFPERGEDLRIKSTGLNSLNNPQENENMRKLQLKKKANARKEPKDYGKNTYILRVPAAISKSEEIVVRADTYEYTPNGDILFFTEIGEDKFELTLSLSSNNVKYCFLADKEFQHPVSVERWPGIAGVKIIEPPVPVEEKLIEREVPVLDPYNAEGVCKFCGQMHQEEPKVEEVVPESPPSVEEPPTEENTGLNEGVPDPVPEEPEKSEEEDVLVELEEETKFD